MRRQVRKSRGLTLIESLLMLVVLAVIGVATGVGLQAASRVPPANDRVLIIDAELQSEMDYWKSYAFGATVWPTVFPYSKTDTVSLIIGGKSVSLNRATTIKKWDANDLTGNSVPRDDFYQVAITIDTQSLTFYVAKPL